MLPKCQEHSIEDDSAAVVFEALHFSSVHGKPLVIAQFDIKAAHDAVDTRNRYEALREEGHSHQIAMAILQSDQHTACRLELPLAAGEPSRRAVGLGQGNPKASETLDDISIEGASFAMEGTWMGLPVVQLQ